MLVRIAWICSVTEIRIAWSFCNWALIGVTMEPIVTLTIFRAESTSAGITVVRITVTVFITCGVWANLSACWIERTCLVHTTWVGLRTNCVVAYTGCSFTSKTDGALTFSARSADCSVFVAEICYRAITVNTTIDSSADFLSRTTISKTWETCHSNIWFSETWLLSVA